MWDLLVWLVEKRSPYKCFWMTTSSGDNVICDFQQLPNFRTNEGLLEKSTKEMFAFIIKFYSRDLEMCLSLLPAQSFVNFSRFTTARLEHTPVGSGSSGRWKIIIFCKRNRNETERWHWQSTQVLIPLIQPM